MAKSGVDGVYTADPNKDSSAVRLETLTYDDALRQDIRVMDQTAMTMCKDNDLNMVSLAWKAKETSPAPSAARRSAPSSRTRVAPPRLQPWFPAAGLASPAAPAACGRGGAGAPTPQARAGNRGAFGLG
ncbi:hypothetical protein GCM10017708_39140 [Arthrobacter citreus]